MRQKLNTRSRRGLRPLTQLPRFAQFALHASVRILVCFCCCFFYSNSILLPSPPRSLSGFFRFSQTSNCCMWALDVAGTGARADCGVEPGPGPFLINSQVFDLPLRPPVVRYLFSVLLFSILMKTHLLHPRATASTATATTTTMPTTAALQWLSPRFRNEC